MALYLPDTSAWFRSGTAPEIADRWEDMLDDDALAMCTPVELELLYSARGPSDYRRKQLELAGLPRLRIDSRTEVLASETQARLAERSQHRGPKPVDLLIAAIAEVNGATLLHYDRHFDLIAAVTGQPVEWLAPAGSLD